MSEPIRAGDLAVIVRPMPCCGADKYLGVVFSVAKVETVMMDCLTCGFRSVRTTLVRAEDGGDVDLSVAKRIPPLEELEREKLVEKLRELI